MKKLIIFSLILMLAATASASPIDDVRSWLRDYANPLSIPTIGTVTVSCDNGATCGYAGDNWHITTNTIGSNQNLAITLPAGKSWTDRATNTVATTQSEVKLTISPLKATDSVPVRAIPLTYRTCWLGSFCGSPTPIPGFEPSDAYSITRVYYQFTLEDTKGSYTKDLQFDYNNQQAVFISDGTSTARFTPTFQINTGYKIALTSVVFLDNGFGTYKAYTATSFITARTATENDIQWNIGGLPGSWLEYIEYMKKKGLQEATSLSPEITNQEATVDYPGGTVGLQGELLIPKAMANTVTVRMDYGKPELSPISASPDPWTIGQGAIHLRVYVKNIGDSSDNFRVGITQNVGTISAVTDFARIEKGATAGFEFILTPTVNTPQRMVITATATAQGSNAVASVQKTIEAVTPPQDCGIFGCSSKTQKVIVTVLGDDRNIISNAPIWQNSVQVSSNGRYEKDLILGTYEFKTDNRTNPGLIASTPISIKLSGGDTETVYLYLTSQPVGEDMTWIFWLILSLIVAVVLIKGGIAQTVLKSPVLLVVVVILIALLWVVWQTYLAATGFMESTNQAIESTAGLLPWNW